MLKDGRTYHAADVNFWGRDVRFGRPHLLRHDGHARRDLPVRGDLRARTVTTVHTNVECPSLSPRRTRVAYKKRVKGLPADAPWHLYVLDLRTGHETALSEPPAASTTRRSGTTTTT